MARYFVLSALLIQILFLSATTSDCRRVDKPKTQTHLEKSGWRTMDTSLEGGGSNLSHQVADDGDREGDEDEEVADFKRSETNHRNTSAKRTTTTTAPPKSKKLVEWDDDELNDLRDPRDAMPFFISFQNSKKISKQDPLAANKIKASNYYRQQNQRERNRLKSGAAKFSRLVYHGQMKANNTMRVIDGIKININTHRPVKINRNKVDRLDDGDRRVSSSKIPASSGRRRVQTSFWIGGGEEPREEPSSMDSHWAETGSSLTNKMIMKSSVDQVPKQQEAQSVKSNWKPIPATDSRSRRSNQRAGETNMLLGHRAVAEKSRKVVGVEDANSKWRPIVDVATGSKQADGDSFRQLNSQQRSSIEEPFDDDGIITVRGTDFEKRHAKQREPKSIDGDDEETPTTTASKNLLENRWTPVETTTLDGSELTNSESITTTTTAATPLNNQSTTITTNGTAAQNNAESAQKSASDINYIYSSQPVATQSVGQSPSNGYYSNYVMQPQQPQPELPLPQQPVAPSMPITNPIIDATSGQTPEMVADREPDTAPLPVVGSSGGGGGGDYSVPQTSAAAFQPAPAPPGRPSTGYGGYGSYGAYGNSYDSHSYYAPAPAPTPAPARVVHQQPVRQAPAQQVVRQEHHYHYYNHQHQSSERQLGQPQQQQQQPQVQQQVIRELQPLFISQPAIVQQPQQSTTAAPAPTQIIREIIKEVPVQTMALPPPPQPIPITRIMLPPPIPIPVPIPLPTREVGGQETSGYASYTPTAPAQRIIRQLSNSIPTVRLQVPQFRIPVPALQLPVRLAPVTNPAPVTRQTGSFVIPPVPQKTTTFLTETQAMPTHTTIMQTTQFTPATRTTVYTTEHQAPQTLATPTGYKAKK